MPQDESVVRNSDTAMPVPDDEWTVDAMQRGMPAAVAVKL